MRSPPWSRAVPSIAARRLSLAALVALAPAVVGSCDSRSPEATAPVTEVRLRIDALIPAGAPEGPTLLPDELRLTATPPDARSAVTLVLPVAGRSANGEVVVERRAAAERWRLRGAAAVRGDTIFRVIEDVLLRVDSPRPDVPLRLVYDGRDAGLAVLTIAPRDTTLEAGQVARPSVRGHDGFGTVLFPAVGWRSRGAAVAQVDSAGRVVAVAAGEAWIVARSWTGIADSMRVRVR